MKKFIAFLLMCCGILVFAGEKVEETYAVDFDNKEFSVDWQMSEAECRKAGFKHHAVEDDDENICYASGDMEYHFRRNGKKLAYCRIYSRHFKKNTIRTAVNRNLKFLRKDTGEEVLWNDLPVVKKQGEYRECTYIVRYPDTVMLFVDGYQGNFRSCEMRIFNPEFYPASVKFAAKKFRSMID